MASKKAAEKKPKVMAGIEVVERAEPLPEGYTILELFIENIKKVRICHLKPAGDVVYVTGENGSGKTSVLDSIIWALDGLGTTTTEPIRAGERVGTIKMDLGDYVVTRNFTRVDPTKSAKGHTYFPKLTIGGKNNEVFKNPQTLLNSFMGSISFDPLAFTRMSDKDQLEELRRLVKFDLDIDELDAAQKADYDERKIVGRTVDSAKAKLEGAEKPEEGLPETPVDVLEITKRLEGAANHNNTVAAARRRKAGHLEDAENDGKEIVLVEALIVDLEAQIAKARKSIVTLQESIATAQQRYDDAEVPDEIDTAAVSAELTAANTLNGAIADAARYRTLQAEYDAAESSWTTLDESIKERARQREEAIARAKMPIDGLGIGDGQVLYEGLPFSQASNAQQIRVSMALGMSSNPKLRVMIIKDGSLLDQKSLALITEMAAKNGFQVWIERVDSSGKVGVVMEDGEASGEEVVSAQ